LTTLVMRWPVMSWKLQDSKMRVTCSPISSMPAVSSTLAWFRRPVSSSSMRSLAARMHSVAVSVAVTTASSSSVAVARCEGGLPISRKAAISRFVWVIAACSASTS
jgi:hypothetical protein